MQVKQTPRHSVHIWDHDWYPRSLLRRTFTQILSSIPSHQKRGVCVDFGAGDRPYEDLFPPPDFKYVACDLVGNPLADIVIVPGRPLAMPDHSADIVMSIQVLEHVWELDWYFTEIKRILKPNGILLLSTHGVWLYHPHPHDYRRWTQEGLQRELAEHGFTATQCEPVVGPIGWICLFLLFALRFALQKLGHLGRLFIPFASTYR